MGGDYLILTMGPSTYGGVTLIPKVLRQAAGHRARGCYGSSHLNVPPIPSEVLKENAPWNQAWKCPLEDTYGQNVTISPSVVFEPAGPPVGSRYHSWKRQVEKAVTAPLPEASGWEL